MRDYPHWWDCDLVDQLRCVAVEAEAAGLPGPMVQAIIEAAEWAELAGGLDCGWWFTAPRAPTPPVASPLAARPSDR